MKLGITTIQRDRGPWLKEWIAFHSLVGFNKFYFYAHECKDDTLEILAGLQKKFEIEVFTPETGTDDLVQRCYQDSYDNFGGEVGWMAYIDGDEFLFPSHADTMDIPLNEFSDKKLSALGVYWACFGSSGHIKEPEGLIIENYKHRAADDYANNRHIKSIVRGGQGATAKALSSHLFQTDLGTYDEKLRLITEGWTKYNPSYEKFRINHYVTQSRKYYENWKRPSKNVESGGRDGIERDEDWWQEHDRNELQDNSMDRFAGPLKELLSSI